MIVIEFSVICKIIKNSISDAAALNTKQPSEHQYFNTDKIVVKRRTKIKIMLLYTKVWSTDHKRNYKIY